MTVKTLRENESQALRNPEVSDAAGPDEIAASGVITRASIVVRAAGKAHGVLELSWNNPGAFHNSVVNKTVVEELFVFGNMIGAAYNRQILSDQRRAARAQQERSELTAKAIGRYGVSAV